MKLQSRCLGFRVPPDNVPIGDNVTNWWWNFSVCVAGTGLDNVEWSLVEW